MVCEQDEGYECNAHVLWTDGGDETDVEPPNCKLMWQTFGDQHVISYAAGRRRVGIIIRKFGSTPPKYLTSFIFGSIAASEVCG